MGQGAAEWNALDLLRRGASRGDWLCLANVHLAPGVAARLLTELASASQSGKFHPEFRLWLTAEPDDQLPVVFLQVGLVPSPSAGG